ncbi:MAG: FAD-dependent oxidoreductase [Candidatus Peregrinibacteria bacterium]|nr:FAD-dependent oxidoreductase [Candidatus Peregrinibacteria bacterium]MDZ4244445.1 FAD-dependent oxidoreductase [Candidatus Gracilibacteria bacterium]
MALIPPIYKPTAVKFKLAKKLELTRDVWEFTFTPLDTTPFNFEPGQFININIPSDEKRIVRSYSIASNPKIKEHLELCIKLVDGPGSRHLGSLNVGDEITGNGPFGLFATKDNYTENMLMIATGTGVAPMKSMMEYQIEMNFRSNMTLFFGVRHEEDIFYDELFNGMAQAHKNIDYKLTLSRPQDSWIGNRGRITNLIQEYKERGDFKPGANLDLENLRIFICGNGDMIKEVVDTFKEMGLSEDKIHHEKFY